MASKLIIAAVLVLGGSVSSQSLPKFMGREVTIAKPELDADGFFPKGPASVCLEGPPQRQCYTAPRDFGRSPTVAAVQLDKDMSALLFSAESGGVSGWAIHFALLRPAAGKDLQDLLNISVANQSQHALWNESALSNARIFVTADFVWGPDEGHYGDHRYIISAYVWRQPSLFGDFRYYLEDRYMTARKYDLESADILSSEKQEILARLRPIKAETERQQRPPR